MGNKKRYEDFTCWLSKDKQVNLKKRWKFYEQSGLNAYRNTIHIPSLMKYKFLIVYVNPDDLTQGERKREKNDYIVYTIGFHYWDKSQSEIWCKLPTKSSVKDFASQLNLWIEEGHTITDFQFTKMNNKRIMTDQEKHGTMGYAIWFYINYADQDIRDVPFVILEK